MLIQLTKHTRTNAAVAYIDALVCSGIRTSVLTASKGSWVRPSVTVYNHDPEHVVDIFATALCISCCMSS